MPKQLVNRLNKRISFVKTTNTKDEYGDVVQQDMVVFSCWSEFYSQGIADKISSIGTIYENTVYFNIPQQLRKKIDNTMKILFEDTKYSIEAIDPRPSEGIARVIAKAVS